MKKLLSSLITCMFICIVFTIQATNIKHKVVFDSKIVIDTIVESDGNIYSIVKFPDCSFSSDEGNPQLPIKIVNLIIPVNEEPISVSCSKSGGKILSLKYPILPVQKPIPTSLNFYGNEFISANKNIYSIDNWLPQDNPIILRTNYIRGNKVVVIAVTPVAYNPKKDQLEVYESIEIDLQLKSSEKELKTSPVRNKKEYTTYLKSMVDNDIDIETYSKFIEKNNAKDSTILKSAALTTGIPIYCEYVIITPSSLSSYFNDFIFWKKQKGIDIELVTNEQIFQNYTGDLISGINDNAGKIRQFLSEAYNNGLEYALLAGDHSAVPIRYGWGDNTVDPVSQIPTDLYFSDFDGDWNIDLDSRYGELNQDGVDYGSEIFVGRLLCTNGLQIQAWVQKLLQYEKNPGNGNTAYLRNAFYSQADQMQQYNQARDISSRFGNIFTTNTVFEEKYNGTPNYNSTASPEFPTGANIINTMNSGFGFVSWFNHGSPENIAVGTKGFNDCGSNDKKKVTNFDNNQTSYCIFPESSNGLDGLTNGSNPFILYSIACETTPFDIWNGISSTSNLGAMATIQSGKGGPVFLGNTRYGYVFSSWYMQRAFTANIVGGTYRLGAAEANSKGSSGDHFVWLSHNLIGCPETEMWTNTPSNFTNISAAKCGSNVVVSTGGITNCTVCIMSSNDNGASYWSVDNSSPTQKTFYNVPEPFVVTITKHNYIPLIIQSTAIVTNYSNAIAGPSLICSSGTTFSVPIIPSGSTVTWSATSSQNNLTINSSTGYAYATSGTIGTGTITAVIHTLCGDIITLPSLNVWVSGFPAPVVSGSPTAKCGYGYTYSVDQLSGSIGQSFYWQSDILEITNPYAKVCSARPVMNGEGTISCTVTACGVSQTAYKDVTAIMCETLLVSPNPSTNEATISIETNSEDSFSTSALWTLEVYDPGQHLKEKKSVIKEKNTKLQTSGWDEGVYILKATIEGRMLSGKLIVKH